MYIYIIQSIIGGLNYKELDPSWWILVLQFLSLTSQNIIFELFHKMDLFLPTLSLSFFALLLDVCSLLFIPLSFGNSWPLLKLKPFFGWFLTIASILSITSKGEESLYLFYSMHSLCLKDVESVDHTMLHSEMAGFLWCSLLGSIELSWVFPRSLDDLVHHWWFPFLDRKGKLIFQAAFLTTTWEIWLARNQCIFEATITSKHIIFRTFGSDSCLGGASSSSDPSPSMLEKEAIAKGVPLGQALDIDIPPPRPKRKPTNPYPRKTSTGTPTSLQVGTNNEKLITTASSSCPVKQTLDLVNELPPEKSVGDEKSGNQKEIQDGENCSEVLTLFQEVSCSSMSSASKNFISTPVILAGPCSFREFVPPMKERKNQSSTNKSYMIIDSKENQKLDRTEANYTDLGKCTIETPNFKKCHPNSEDRLIQGERTESTDKKIGVMSSNDLQASQSYPRHVPVHVVEGFMEPCRHKNPDVAYPVSVAHQVGAHGDPHSFTDPTASAAADHHSNISGPSVHQPLPTFHPPFTPVCNQDSYLSFFNVPSTFASLIVSTLLQNPAAHAAASVAASFWPCKNVESSADSPTSILGGLPLGHITSSPNIGAIAAATVAAATAWWAAHGLLPLCPLLHSSSTCTPPCTAATPSTDSGQDPALNKSKVTNTPEDPQWDDRQLQPECSEALKAQRSASKPPSLSSSDSGESGGVRSNIVGLKIADPEQKPLAVTEIHESNKAGPKKQVDRSSCGSNTPSGSEIEIDASEKYEKSKEEPKDPAVSHPAADSNNHRNKCNSNMSESWKEVSEEGRLAFQALFSREVLPQSFSPPHDLRNKGYHKNSEEGSQNLGDEAKLPLNLNCKTLGSCTTHPRVGQDAALGGDGNVEKGLLAIGIGPGKHRTRRTGFKPYKRCSVEANESRVANASSQGEERSPKRMRFEEKAST